MRHPTTGLSEDDLSRLTGSSSSTASSGNCLSSSTSSAGNTPAHKEGVLLDHNAHSLNQQHQNEDEDITTVKNNQKNSHTHITPSRIGSTYLPEFINPSEWQKSRKRKERLDSSSSATQDRKLQRSNSEELLPADTAAVVNTAETTTPSTGTGTASGGGNALKVTRAVDVIRRVSSEDFKKTSYAAYEQELNDEDNCNAVEKQKQQQQQHQQPVDENDASLANRQTKQQQQQQQQCEPLPPTYSETFWISGPTTKDMTRRARYETSPARSHRHSPVRGLNANGNGNGNGNANGNGNGNCNGNGNGSGSKHRDSDDSECEHERRRSSERFCKSRAPPGRRSAGVTKKSSSSGGMKYLPPKRSDENAYKYDLSALKYERRGFISKKVAAAAVADKSGNDLNDNNLIDFHQQQQQSQPQPQSMLPAAPANATPVGGADETAVPASATAATAASVAPPARPIPRKLANFPITSAQEALPWDRSVAEDQAPVLSRRYSSVRHNVDNIDTAAKLSKIMPYPQQFHKQSPTKLYDDDADSLDSMNAFRAFTSLENLRTREVMQQVIPAMMSFQSPEERLKQVNKRLAAMKKKLAQLEEAFETRMGYRPSQAERLNDKYMKNIMAELNKLRKERHELKSDPMSALGLKVSGGLDGAMKLEKMKSTLLEIEQSLSEKRLSSKRSVVLDELTPDQLVQEKTAVQHGLLYFESLYGRPATKEERDSARPLYDRYRQLKRMVSRSVMFSGSSAAGAPELPTILEHEAMVFEATPQQYSSNNSTDTTNSPSDSVAPTMASSDDSTTTNTNTTVTELPSASIDANENVKELSLEQLWEQLDKIREEKNLLKSIIREYETAFEEQNGRKMLKNDRRTIEETYAQYKEKKAKTRLLQALIKKHISR